jgi:hypothetical protein
LSEPTNTQYSPFQATDWVYVGEVPSVWNEGRIIGFPRSAVAFDQFEPLELHRSDCE